VEELLGPHQAPVSRALPAVCLSGVQHPRIVFKPARRLTRIGHHAEDVVKFEHGYKRR